MPSYGTYLELFDDRSHSDGITDVTMNCNTLIASNVRNMEYGMGAHIHFLCFRCVRPSACFIADVTQTNLTKFRSRGRARTRSLFGESNFGPYLCNITSALHKIEFKPRRLIESASSSKRGNVCRFVDMSFPWKPN
jgi:hypothetical protein